MPIIQRNIHSHVQLCKSNIHHVQIHSGVTPEHEQRSYTAAPTTIRWSVTDGSAKNWETGN